METVLFIALSAFYCLTTLRFLAPVRVPDRLALLLYGAAAYGLTYAPHVALEALSGAGLLVLITVLAKLDPPNGWDWHYAAELLRPRMPARRRPRLHPQEQPGPGRRIPRL